MDRTRIRAQVALATAICFAGLAALSQRAPDGPDAGCDKPAWALLSWSGSDCR